MNHNHPQPPDITCKATRSDGSPCQASPTQRPYRAMSDADIDRYLLKLRKRIRDDPRPDPAAMTLPELDAYVNSLAAAASRAKRVHIAMLGKVTPWTR